MKIREQFVNARKFGVPLIAIETSDPGATIATLTQALNGDKKHPALSWDIVRGMKAVNEYAKEPLKRLAPSEEEALNLINPTNMLSRILDLPDKSVVFMYNAPRFYENEAVAQGIWNLRDEFKATGRTLVLLGPSIKLPSELYYDVILFDEPLPSDADLGSIITGVHEYAGLKPPKDEQQKSLVQAARGLATFPAEQAVALSLSKEGVNIEKLWELKRKMIEQTPGLTMYIGGPTFDDIGGITRLKDFGRRLFAGPERPSVIVQVEEMEKMLAGAGSDTSGTSQDQLMVMLDEMEQMQWKGIILVGHPGTCKTMYAKSIGATHKVPTLRFDAGAMKDQFVGTSEKRIRNVMKVIKGMAGANAYWIATCNSLPVVSPALVRRFTDGIYFTDLPDETEKPFIWAVNEKAFGVSGQRPEDTNYTGADIRNICSIAYRLNVSLVEAATYITPVAKSDPQSIERLRKQADGSWLSATYPGVYQLDRKKGDWKGDRKVEL